MSMLATSATELFSARPSPAMILKHAYIQRYHGYDTKDTAKWELKKYINKPVINFQELFINK